MAEPVSDALLNAYQAVEESLQDVPALRRSTLFLFRAKEDLVEPLQTIGTDVLIRLGKEAGELGFYYPLTAARKRVVVADDIEGARWDNAAMVATAKELGVKAVVATPIVIDNQVVGAVNFFPSEALGASGVVMAMAKIAGELIGRAATIGLNHTKVLDLLNALHTVSQKIQNVYSKLEVGWPPPELRLSGCHVITLGEEEMARCVDDLREALGSFRRRIQMSKILLGSPMELLKSQQNLSKLVSDTVNEFREGLRAGKIAGVNVTEEIAPDLMAEVYGDGVRGLVREGLKNAHRHGRVGEKPLNIIVRLVRSIGSLEAVIEIEDDGKGLATLPLPNVENVDQGQALDGVGLFLAKHLVEAHGGKLVLLPRQGAGSILRMTLRLRSREEGNDER